MRKRFNRNAVCSSENYSASRKAHIALLEENHKSRAYLTVSSEIDTNFSPVYINRTIRVFGKPMTISYWEYQEHNLKELGF